MVNAVCQYLLSIYVDTIIQSPHEAYPPHEPWPPHEAYPPHWPPPGGARPKLDNSCACASRKLALQDTRVATHRDMQSLYDHAVTVINFVCRLKSLQPQFIADVVPAVGPCRTWVGLRTSLKDTLINKLGKIGVSICQRFYTTGMVCPSIISLLHPIVLLFHCSCERRQVSARDNLPVTVCACEHRQKFEVLHRLFRY